MTSVIASAAHAAHNVAASLLAQAPIQIGQAIPAAQIKEDSPDSSTALNLTGKNIIIGVPGAFTTPCNSHIPAYIENYQKFKDKGVNEIYVFAVNDTFVTKAWKEKLAPNGTPIHFIADDKSAFVSALGLVFDASPLLGGPRSKRFAIVTEGTKVLTLAVEDQPPSVTVTSAESVLASL
ncbi:Redoxin [Crepidotus variabilis]|uniref:Redoxin n=1 Tax=Crepidotus variabilis TaxID=179855 RepID=A0A9P6E616_9AGAR|nr:Redoxin [Crepidotus variabilis]